MSDKLNILAKEIIQENEYLTLATIDENNHPWVCILAYAFDDKYNFYFISLPTAKHSTHINKNKHVSFSIFDSRQNFGYGTGLQIEGKVEEVQDKQLSTMKNVYFERNYPFGNINNEFMKGIESLIQKKIYRFYKIMPIKVWINDPDAETDKRAQVDL